MKKALLFFLVVAIGFAEAIAQQNVTGIVTDPSDGSGLPGVNVLIKGTNIGTVTRVDGNYSIDVNNSEDVLVFSFIGYEPQEIVVGSQSVINVGLKLDLRQLEEVVVVGYGQLRKADLATAQTSISSEDIERTVNTTMEQALQGRSPGVQVTQNTGAPGGGVSVNIRGTNSLSGTNQPLYVIDGVQIAGSTSSSGLNPLAFINPSDIADIQILQGPSATATYGSRGTNGVVIISTKKGEKGKVKISYNYLYTLQSAPKALETLNLPQYAQMENEYKSAVEGDVREDFLDPSLLGPGTNWQDELFRSDAINKHQLSFSGGTEKTTFYLSGERFVQKGVALASGFERKSLRLNMTNKIREWADIGINFNYTQLDDQLGASNLNDNNLIVNAIRLAPQIPVRNIDGSFGGGNPNNDAEQFSPVNPVGLASISTNEITRRRLQGGVNAGIKIIDGLELRTNLNTNIEFSNATYFLPTYNFGFQLNGNANIRNDHNLSTNWNWSQTLQYTKQINRHRINAMATHEAQESTWNNLQGTRSGFLTNEVLDLNAGDALSAGNTGGQGSWGLESYLARINYSYDDRYVVMANFRTDGSANFGPGKKWGYFPSIALMWRLSEESFFDVSFISDLRLRFESGTTGNDGSPDVIYGTLSSAIPSDLGVGFRAARYANPDFQWESTFTNNLGLTFGLFDDRIQLDMNVYHKTSDQLILTAELPWYLGTRGDAAINPPDLNVGSLENKGWDISLQSTNINKSNLKWQTSLNISSVKTEVTGLNIGSTHITREAPDWFLNNFAQRTEVGSTPWMFYGYIEEGIFQSKEEVENSPRPTDGNGDLLPVSEDGIWVGDVKYKDVSGPDGVPDGKITADDRTFIGNPNPKWFGGISNTVSFKGFEVSIFVTAQYGQQVFNYLRYQNSNPNNINVGQNMFLEAFDYARVELDEAGQPYLSNPGTTINRFSSTDLNANYGRLTDKYLEDGSFVRIKNISVNYDLPSSLIEKMKVVQNIRLGVSAQNVYTFTNYSGYDPEVGSYVGANGDVAGDFSGVDYGRYPLTPIYSFNLAIDF